MYAYAQFIFNKSQLETQKQTEKDEFINDLITYINMRRNEAPTSKEGEILLDSTLTIFGSVAGFSARVKINAAQNMIFLLQGKKNIKFSSKELEALMDKRLHNLIQKYKERNLLPPEYEEQENARSKSFWSRK